MVKIEQYIPVLSLYNTLWLCVGVANKIPVPCTEAEVMLQKVKKLKAFEYIQDTLFLKQT